MMRYDAGHTVDPSEPEDSDDEYIQSVFEDADLSSIDKTATKYVNYTNEYVPLWKRSEAFQETYQNWYVVRPSSTLLSRLTNAGEIVS